ncbi:ADR354Wp [Eremothecium gossypii ATCC 10895]|uniref:ADR354Wp n=1 Tax=Eremothecium gossypii (strain ATCC 10895 / CBS 109.51 / FGSC 9923 / NRRL Y-1056) TaxID=284811 RepID=Q759C3_EREGS|nr:ADR354Wp [Eremothecium gossypii ATCC 10895]AAS52274.1 ADR354Wp [Eremothecium gossypii ATCC 10895]AEY96572.1 FADR354Wp [Eremothecium gossypii FDAG1]
MSYEVGTRCWYPDKEQGWIGGEITKHRLVGDKYQLDLTLENGEVVEITAPSVEEGSCEELPLLRNPPILEATEDLTSLSYLNEPAVLHAIKARYAQLNIYTYSGIVLIATNPFDRVDQLYSQDMIQAYAGRRRGELEPHLFAIAEEAYSLMKNSKQNQTIVVSGESGAGKTVSAKYIMRYFATVEQSNLVGSGGSMHHIEMSETEKKILATNPIMEAFGNAKTTRNDNSSRFGKYLEILFDKDISIIGARIRTYLLERSRLVFQPPSERNYHIFYQLLAGLPEETKKELKLGGVEEYHYMNQGGASEIQGVDDREEYAITTKALSLVDITERTQTALFKVLAALLHIGNIDVKKTRNDASVSATDPSLEIACELLGIDAYNFAKWITKKQITTRSEKIVSNLNYGQAVVARDSVAKFIYSALFDWLVENINNVLCNPAVINEIASFIGVLDIYGFEHFEKNSFEQFCINYANEKLQQEFNQHVFKLEQEEYVKEEIQWSFIEFNDNQPCIDLIENKLGILSLLDEESRLPAGSDETWTQKLYQTLDKPPTNTVFSKPRFGQTKFVVSHYAHDVAYDVEGFIEKNRDTVSDGHLEVLKGSTNETLLAILETIDRNAAKLAEKLESQKKPGPTTRTVNRKPTLGSLFKQSLVELMSTINSTNVHYIRCIKPNEEKEAWKFDNLMVLSQLRACGVLETIRISCAGFPTRWTYDEFALRYHILVPSTNWTKIFATGTTEEEINQLCKNILDTTVTDKEKYQLGNTKIFFKAGMLAFLEKKRTDKLNSSSTMIQKKIKGIYYRRRYLEITNAIKRTHSVAKGNLLRARIDLEFKTWAAITIQSLYRGSLIRRDTIHLLDSIIRTQSLLRRSLARKELRARLETDAAITIQKNIRAFKPRTSYITNRRSTIVVQSLVRRRFAKRKLETLKQEAKSVSHLKEVSYKLENKVIELTESLAAKVKENKDLNSRIKELQLSLNESANIRELLKTKQEEYRKSIDQQKDTHAAAYEEVTGRLTLAMKEVDDARQEIDQLKSKQEDLKLEVKAKIEELSKVRQDLSDSRTQNSDLSNEVSSLKEEIARLHNAIRNAPATGTLSPTRSKRISSYSGLDNIGSPKQWNVVSLNNGLMEEETRSIMSQLSQINDELYKLLNDDRPLTSEIVEGLLKSGKIPQPGFAANLTRKEVLYPARVLIIILSDMWRLGLTEQSERFLAEVLSTIQTLVTNLKGDNVIINGAFWLTNVRELYSFAIYAHDSILNDNAYIKDLNEDEYKQYVTLVSVLKDDFESLSYNIYNIWLKKLQKELEKRAVSAVVMSQSLPGFIVPESSAFLPKIFSSSSSYKMDDILTFFNTIYWSMKAYHVETEVYREVIMSLLRYVDAICFNDLIMKRNFLSWKRGLQLNYNVTRLEEWCKVHHIPEGSDCLEHMLQASKLLQLKKANMEDINIIWEICSSLKPAQIQKLISQYSAADYEVPIPQEILSFVADRVKKESALSNDGKSASHSSDIFLPVATGSFADPFSQIEPREINKIEAHIPAWLNLPISRRVVELITENVSAQESQAQDLE